MPARATWSRVDGRNSYVMPTTLLVDLCYWMLHCSAELLLHLFSRFHDSFSDHLLGIRFVSCQSCFEGSGTHYQEDNDQSSKKCASSFPCYADCSNIHTSIMK